MCLMVKDNYVKTLPVDKYWNPNQVDDLKNPIAPELIAAHNTKVEEARGAETNEKLKATGKPALTDADKSNGKRNETTGALALDKQTWKITYKKGGKAHKLGAVDKVKDTEWNPEQKMQLAGEIVGSVGSVGSLIGMFLNSFAPSSK